MLMAKILHKGCLDRFRPSYPLESLPGVLEVGTTMNPLTKIWVVVGRHHFRQLLPVRYSQANKQPQIHVIGWHLPKAITSIKLMADIWLLG